MLHVLQLFPSETDATEVDALLTQRLLPLLKESPGLRGLRVSAGTIMSRGGPSPYSRVVEASFDGLADWMGAVEALNAAFATASPAERESAERNAPLVVFFDVVDAA
jgi:hypothetical protein